MCIFLFSNMEEMFFSKMNVMEYIFSLYVLCFLEKFYLLS